MVLSIILEIGFTITWWSIKTACSISNYTVSTIKNYMTPQTRDEYIIEREREFTKELTALMKKYKKDKFLLEDS